MSRNDTRTADRVWINTLNRLFWMVWVALPVMVGLTVWSIVTQGQPVDGMTPEQAQCLQILPTVGRLSTIGQAIIWVLFAFQISIYVVLLWFLHGMVRRFAQERIFVSETLASLHWMGVILIVWPFLETATIALAAFALKAIGDVPFFAFSFNLDVAPIAVGLFLLATKHVIERAIALKEDADLTI
jgi:hypothetical protein